MKKPWPIVGDLVSSPLIIVHTSWARPPNSTVFGCCFHVDSSPIGIPSHFVFQIPNPFLRRPLAHLHLDVWNAAHIQHIQSSTFIPPRLNTLSVFCPKMNGICHLFSSIAICSPSTFWHHILSQIRAVSYLFPPLHVHPSSGPKSLLTSSLVFLHTVSSHHT